MTFGEKLKDLRIHNGWSMNDLITRINDETGGKVSRGRLSMWEHDSNDPNFRTVQSIARIFNISVDYFSDNAGPINQYRLDDVGAAQLHEIYVNSTPRRKHNILEYARQQFDEQNQQ